MTRKTDPPCHCGRPLHYSDSKAEIATHKVVKEHGHFVTVIGADGRRWRVQRHYLALHGILLGDLPTLGFEEVTVSASERTKSTQ